MAFFGNNNSQAGNNSSSTESQQIKKELQDQIAQELAVANATELVSKISENCFEKCVQLPGQRLLSNEDQCVNLCLEKYMRSWNVISKAYISRIQLST